MQALLPAIYPMLKSGFALSFGQIGLLTLCGPRRRGRSSLVAAARGRRLGQRGLLPLARIVSGQTSRRVSGFGVISDRFGLSPGMSG